MSCAKELHYALLEAYFGVDILQLPANFYDGCVLRIIIFFFIVIFISSKPTIK